MSETKDLNQFRVTWKDLIYTVPDKALGRKEKTILNGVSGHFKSGQITGILGPSGCGKSSLLGCLCGLKKSGLSGSITISTNYKVKFAFIAQENYILNRISIRESLMYSSLLKNDSGADHKGLVNDVIEKLKIESCADNRPDRCSGGQLKRVLIACELVSKPNILILDEPTTGLDSVTTWQLVNFFLQLVSASEPMAVVVTIHQPSAKLFNLFHSIYLLSSYGQHIYIGSPKTLLDFFSEYGLQCPQYTNPADFALEVCAKEHGSAKLLTLSTVMKIEAMDLGDEKYQINVINDFNTLRDVWYLTERSIKSMIRDPFMLPMRFFGFITVGIVISILYGFDSGVLSGCMHEFSIGDGKDMVAKFKNIAADIIENCCGIAFICMFGWFAGIFPVLLIFPMELDVFVKETGNGYYSCFSYFTSKVLSDLPFTLLLPNLFSFTVYYLTGQYMGDVWRIYHFAFIYILISFNSTALGFLIGSALAHYRSAIAFIGMLSLVPLILLSGIMIRLESMPTYFRSLTYGNYIRFALSAALTDIYGFDRCVQSRGDFNETDILDRIPVERLLELYSSDRINVKALQKTLNTLLVGIGGESRSLVMTAFEINDSDYVFSIAMLFTHIIIFRALTYFVILRKAEKT